MDNDLKALIGEHLDGDTKEPGPAPEQTASEMMADLDRADLTDLVARFVDAKREYAAAARIADDAETRMKAVRDILITAMAQAGMKSYARDDGVRVTRVVKSRYYFTKEFRADALAWAPPAIHTIHPSVFNKYVRTAIESGVTANGERIESDALPPFIKVFDDATLSVTGLRKTRGE